MAEVCNFQSNHTKGLVLHGLQPTIGLFPLMHQLQGIRQFANMKRLQGNQLLFYHNPKPLVPSKLTSTLREWQNPPTNSRDAPGQLDLHKELSSPLMLTQAQPIRIGVRYKNSTWKY
jgi:hypothetical protein